MLSQVNLHPSDAVPRFGKAWWFFEFAKSGSDADRLEGNFGDAVDDVLSDPFAYFIDGSREGSEHGGRRRGHHRPVNIVHHGEVPGMQLKVTRLLGNCHGRRDETIGIWK